MLELQGLSRRYGDVVALDDLSFTVREGQMFGFVGPNGAGKTTTMRIVLGVLEPDRGEVRWRGRPVDAAIRRRFGYMPEERGLYPKMRVRDQLDYFARLHGLSAQEAGSAADYWIERLGVAERANDRVEQLSLGNQQRVQLAAALVHNPEVLVLDEPFSGLDPVGVDVLAEVLAERAADGIPVIFSSHQLELVERLCEAVAIINHGRLVAAGPVEELRASGGKRRYQVEVADAAGDWVADLDGVTVLEKREVAGGKVSSWQDPDGDWVESGLHVFFGAYRNLLRFLRETGLDDNLVWMPHCLTFSKPGGILSPLTFPASLPAPFHGLTAIARNRGVLTNPDKLRTGAGLLWPILGDQAYIDRQDGLSYEAWHLRHGLSRRSLADFWRRMRRMGWAASGSRS